MKLALFCLFASATLCSGAAQFVVVSDIHFNPLADPALVPQLMGTDAARWESALANDVKGPKPAYGDDSTWSLLSSLVAGLQAVHPRPKMIVVTGDILPHKFQERFAAVARTKDASLFRSFVAKTATFVGLELEKAAGGVPVIYAIGNNDEECGDYALQPNGPFLQDTAATVQRLSHASDAGFSSWVSTGSYVVPNPLARHHRIISLNTNFWARRYTNACADKAQSAADPGDTVLTWLSNQLQDARRHGDVLWLAYHIPPGIDGHSSSRANSVVPMWKPKFADSFRKLLDQYHATIRLNLAAHTHLDDIRLIETGHGPSLVLLTPAVSPNVGQNPAFRVVTVNSHAQVKDLLTYYLPDLDSAKWQLEYSARSAYGLREIDAASFQALYQKMDESPSLADQWKLFYAVSRAEGLNNSKAYLRSLYCATGHADAEAFQACLNAQQ